MVQFSTFGAMIAIDQTVVSEELLEKKFVCDLSRCKGACCVEGESGAPLDKEELKLLVNDDKFVHDKLMGLLKVKNAEIRDGNLQITPKGLKLLKFFTFYRGIIGARDLRG